VAGLRIERDDLSLPAVREFLAEHVTEMYATSPAESVHALGVEELRVPTVSFWTAWEAETLLGCGALKDLGEGDLEVKSMRTTAAARGRGVGSAILDHLLAQARRRGARRVLLETGTEDYFAPARRLYASRGFGEREPFADYVADPNSVFMELVLDADALGSPTAIELVEVTFTREGRPLLDDVTLTVRRGEHWALIGANGAGKSTLLNICGAVTFPSRGTARILGSRMGRVDLRDLRRSIGYVNPRHPLRSDLTAEEIVWTGETGSIELVPRWQPDDDVRRRGELLLKAMGLDGPEGPHWQTMSQGERGRALIARALMPDPPLLLLDEPSTGLDVAAREQMIRTIADLPETSPGLTSVMVTHHFEELPPSTTHAALLRKGRLVAAGRVGDVLTSELVTSCFDHPIEIERRRGRWYASAR